MRRVEVRAKDSPEWWERFRRSQRDRMFAAYWTDPEQARAYLRGKMRRWRDRKLMAQAKAKGERVARKLLGMVQDFQRQGYSGPLAGAGR